MAAPISRYFQRRTIGLMPSASSCLASSTASWCEPSSTRSSHSARLSSSESAASRCSQLSCSARPRLRSREAAPRRPPTASRPGASVGAAPRLASSPCCATSEETTSAAAWPSASDAVVAEQTCAPSLRHDHVIAKRIAHLSAARSLSFSSSGEEVGLAACQRTRPGSESRRQPWPKLYPPSRRGGPRDRAQPFERRRAERAHHDLVDGLLVRLQRRRHRRRVGLGHADRAGLAVERLEVLDVALVQLPVEALFLQQALAGVVADRHPHVAEDRRRLVAAGLAGAFEHALARPGGLLRRHPVEEDAVGLGAGQRAHLRAHRSDRDPGVLRQRRAHRSEALPHDAERPLGEAGADADPEAARVDPALGDLGGDVFGRVAIERQHRDSEIEPRRPCEHGVGLEPARHRVVVGPDRAVAELLALGRQRAGDLGVEPGGDAEAAPVRHRRCAPAAPRTRCAACGGTCPRGAP